MDPVVRKCKKFYHILVATRIQQKWMTKLSQLPWLHLTLRAQ
uniref:Uncharacterized protein n=1 Tax=Rhizophora mucronata TaxID=61149 RepID=A0A2P2QPS3_RHIMU